MYRYKELITVAISFTLKQNKLYLSRAIVIQMRPVKLRIKAIVIRILANLIGKNKNNNQDQINHIFIQIGPLIVHIV